MKKIRDLFISVVISLVLGFVSFNLYQSYSNEKEQKLIENSLPTAQEELNFQNRLIENTYYYYNRLSDSDKEAYVTLYSSFMSFDEFITISVNESSLKDIFKAVLYDNPHIYWIEHDFEYVFNDNSIKFIPHYRYNQDETKSIDIQIQNKINYITDVADEYDSDYEKELFIHNYVCEYTVYDDTIDGNTIYDVLIDGKAVCEGYAKTIQILLEAVDIDNYLVVGESNFEGEIGPHMWNIVTIDDTNYHLDATWNDNDKENDINYFYFNVTDDVIKKDHFNILPVDNFCISNDANYFVQCNSYFENFNDFNEHISQSAEILRTGKNKVEFLFNSKEDYNKAVKSIDEDSDFFRYVVESIKRSGRNLKTSEISYITVDEHNYLCVVFKEG